MYNGIGWLPEIINEKYYEYNGKTNYYKLIEDAYNNFVMDFCNPSSPVIFRNKQIVISDKILDCSSLKTQECFNIQYYTCSNCKFKSCFDIFNHICTSDYYLLHKQNNKISVPKLKKRKNGRRIPRTPGKFNIARLVRAGWIRAIIENCDDKLNVKINENFNQSKTKLIDINFILIQEKYKISIEPIYDNRTNCLKYYILKTAFYTGN